VRHSVRENQQGEQIETEYTQQKAAAPSERKGLRVDCCLQPLFDVARR